MTKKKLFSSPPDLKKYSLITRNYHQIAQKLLILNRSNPTKSPIDCNTIITIAYELMDCIRNDKEFFIKNIYENAFMSENRKMIENLQMRIMNFIEENMSSDQLPVDLSDLRYVEQKAILDMKSEFLSIINKDTPMEGAIQFFFELHASVAELLESKRLLNDDYSKNQTDELLNSILMQFNKVEELSKDDLRSPMLMENLEGVFLSLLEHYNQIARGIHKCSPTSPRPGHRRNHPQIHPQLQQRTLQQSQREQKRADLRTAGESLQQRAADQHSQREAQRGAEQQHRAAEEKNRARSRNQDQRHRDPKTQKQGQKRPGALRREQQAPRGQNRGAHRRDPTAQRREEDHAREHQPTQRSNQRLQERRRKHSEENRAAREREKLHQKPEWLNVYQAEQPCFRHK
jgi:hypothetical protein